MFKKLAIYWGKARFLLGAAVTVYIGWKLHQWGGSMIECSPMDSTQCGLTDTGQMVRSGGDKFIMLGKLGVALWLLDVMMWYWFHLREAAFGTGDWEDVPDVVRAAAVLGWFSFNGAVALGFFWSMI